MTISRPHIQYSNTQKVFYRGFEKPCSGLITGAVVKYVMALY